MTAGTVTAAAVTAAAVSGALLALTAIIAPTSISAQALRPAEGVEWHEVPWSGNVVDVALVRPDPGLGGPHPVIFALPWGSGSAELVETFVASYWRTEPARRGYYVVSPEIRGSTLSVTASSVLPAIFSWMDETLDYDPERVALVGASNGGLGAFHAALAYPNRFDAMMVLPGQYRGDPETLVALEEIPILMLVGERDEPWVEGTEARIEALASLGLDPEVGYVGGQGHVLRIDPRALLDWIDAALE